ncbi:hypothetical protein PPERSA_08349 [Pseudocohnilembus persalinus]|uniref:SIS domain-containing protein n=1 Tax=Pseudocohnilembus persalinus TaxID=266149 RepID=A0A0V0QPH4_PSEPJ|nr:hypothetical protein PPERSA_08349 [Pseudocohnilembus persalinus]|eukprot:KRX04134.1 hypothetical protein PPERSA_08349 [Pseudocohnilembus persalinus]
MELLNNVSQQAKSQAQDFLKIAPDFKLGNLPTEQPAPETMGLSDVCQTDIKQAINMVRKLDLKTISVLQGKLKELEPLYQDITKTLDNGGRIYICGCGATGRLSLALESLWRQEVRHQFLNKNQELFTQLEDRVVSFMAGGDVALIKSVEDFEDHPEFAVQQLKDLKFTSKDLLIGSSEGGETPWVIGAVEHAADMCEIAPWFIYCNPDEILVKTVERSKQIIESQKVNKINLTVGNQAITGSTRMQCTTILMYGIGLALLHYHKLTQISKEKQDKQFLETITQEVQVFSDTFNSFNEADFLADFTTKEAQIYKDNNFIFYNTDYYFSLSILTDTTERSPTFSLFPFENQQDQKIIPSLCHLVMINNEDKDKPILTEYSEDAVRKSWNTMLGFRDIRALEGKFWESYADKVSTKRALGQDFSNNIITQRKKYCKDGKATHYHFNIQKNYENSNITFSLYEDGKENEEGNKIVKNLDLNPLNNRRLCENMFLKIMLNTHSTLVMGIMGKIKSNLMSWVRPSNNKLIDRSIRYIQHLLEFYKDQFIGENQKIYDQIDYSLICTALYSEIESLNYGEAIVLKTFQRIVKDLFNKQIEV